MAEHFQEFSVEENRRITPFGRINFREQKIQINPKRGDVVNTIIHERVHAENPNASEDRVTKKSREIESKMSLREMSDLLQDTVKDTERGFKTHHTEASNVIKVNIKT